MTLAISILICILTVLSATAPLLSFLLPEFGYSFELSNETGYFTTITALIIALTVLSIMQKKGLESKLVRVLSAFAPLLLLLNALPYTGSDSDVLIRILSLISLAGAVFLAIRHVKPTSLKVVALVIPILLLLLTLLNRFYVTPILQASGLSSSSGTVKESIESPGGLYRAEIGYFFSPGCFGPTSFVQVTPNKELTILFFEISPLPEQIYTGPEMFLDDMEVYWKDDHHLIIFSEEYIIE